MDVAQLVADLGYPAVALAIFAEDFGLPAPGETVLVAAAIAASQGQLNIFAVAGVGFVAAVLGDNVGFAIGHYGGRRFVLRVGGRLRLGSHRLVTEERMEQGEGFFRRFGAWVIIGARFVEGLRQFNGILAGILRVPWARFLVFNVVGAALWVGFWSTGAYLAGDHIAALHRYYRWLAPAAIAIVVLAAVIYWVRRTHRGRRTGAEPPAPAGS
ncbi:MAG: DedA family protein [Thermoleophilia bacterium]